jgi:diguanylate cyclase (GGDEF)-like protein
MTEAALQLTASNPIAAKDVAKRVRQRRPAYIGQGISYLVDTAILLLYYAAGTTSLRVAIVYATAGVGWTLLALAMSELQVTERFRDHYLTVPQSIVSISIQLAAIYLAPEVGFYFVCIIFIVLGFASLRMSARQTGMVWTFTAVGLTLLFACTDQPIAMPMENTADRHLALLCFVTALGRCAFIGLYGASFREMLYKRGKELKEAHARIEELAQVDELTGLLNRRYIMKVLNEELARAQRNGTPCSVVIIDLDHFKRINDRFGHPIGDEVLRTFAISVTANLRAIDRVGRYGGEEFLLVLPDASRDQAVQTVDRLRDILAHLNWDAIADGLNVTMSAGLSQTRPDDTSDDILCRSDKALYRAKDAGRNRVVAG